MPSLKLSKLCIIILWTIAFQPVSAPAAQIEVDQSELLQAAVSVAGSMETYRRLPDGVQLGARKINTAQFFYLAANHIVAITSDARRAQNISLPGHRIGVPPDPYPAIELEDRFYSEPFSRPEYLQFFRQWIGEFARRSEFPSALTIRATTAQIRFSEAVYYAAGILRAVDMLGRLPELWGKYVISPRGLVPWDTPRGYEEYTSTLSTLASLPFFPETPRRYYASSAHQYDTLKLAKTIIGDENDPFDAGRKIHRWVRSQWLDVVGYSSGKMQFVGMDSSALELANFFFYTSGVPPKVISGLLRAVGIPASPSGAAYFPGRGWVSIDIHEPYGTDPKANRFYYDEIPPKTQNMPYPSPEDDFIGKIKEISRLNPVEPGSGEQRSLFVNPSDVLRYGADYVLDHSGDFDTIIVTVKTVKGNIYFHSDEWTERETRDVLSLLVQEAHRRGKRIFAAVSTLADRTTAEEQPEWRQMLNERKVGPEVYPNLHISPCITAYKGGSPHSLDRKSPALRWIAAAQK